MDDFIIGHTFVQSYSKGFEYKKKKVSPSTLRSFSNKLAESFVEIAISKGGSLVRERL